jgi:hypothetical protein
MLLRMTLPTPFSAPQALAAVPALDRRPPPEAFTAAAAAAPLPLPLPPPRAPPAATPPPASRQALMAQAQAFMRLMRLGLALLATAAVCVACVAAEHVYLTRLDFARDPATGDALGRTPGTHALKLASTVLTALTLGALGALQAARFRLARLRGTVLPQQRFWRTGFARELALEACLMAVHCPVGCYANWRAGSVGEQYSTYDADSAISMLQLLRLRPLLQLVLLWLSGFESAQTVVVAHRSGVKLGEELAVRAIFKRHAIFATLGAYFFCVALLSYCMHVSERVVCDGAELLSTPFCAIESLNLNYWYNCFWLVIVTSLTIG